MPDDIRWPTTSAVLRLDASSLDAPSLDALPHRDQLAFISQGDPWSLSRLALAVERLAAGMAAHGIRSGERVALHLRNGPEIAVAYLACFRLGAVAVPLNLRFKQTELEGVLRRLRPSLYLGQRDLYSHVAGIDRSVLPAEARFLVDTANAPLARSWTELHRERAAAPPAGVTDPHAPAVLLMTSGTTGQPKFVAHSLSTLTEGAERARHLGMGAGQWMVGNMPMVHMSGLWTLLASLRLGIRLVMCDGSEPGAILDTIEQYGCDVLGTLPAMATMLVAAQRQRPRALSSLRLTFSGGDVPPAGQQAAWAEVFPCALHSFWGATEAMGSCTFGTSRGAVSRLAPGTQMRLVDSEGAEVAFGETGEMVLRGPHVMLGYWQLPGGLSGLQDGWYRSGDLMRREPDGGIRFVTRLKDLIVRAGSNISPVEVEAVIASHPAVAEVGVAGVADPLLGQRVMAMVRLHDGAGPHALADIGFAISARLADYKLPERLFPASALPRNALGKIDRRQLSALIEARLAADAPEDTASFPHRQVAALPRIADERSPGGTMR